LKFNDLPRIRLANLPTPLQELGNFSRELGGPKVYVKRDDMTGLAFGGNKTRKLEYILAEALAQNSDYIVTSAGFHSNWCTQTAAAARRLGLGVVLIKKGPENGYDPDEYDGNHLLHFLMGAEIKVARPEEVENVIEETMDELREKGHTPFRAEVTGSTPPGAAGYMNCMLEIMSQTVDMGFKPDYVIHTSGSGGTQAGLVIGARAFSTGINVLASTSGSTTREDQVEKVHNIVQEALQYMDLDLHITKDEIHVYDQYAGGGYGYISDNKVEAVNMLAKTEGLFIDPVYTATSVSCLIDLTRQNFFDKDDSVIFIHTGGTPALFLYKEALKSYKLKGSLPWVIPPWSPDASQ
jgi:D-cysteine desulfhydrase family pyridoxal phosphate-dependent enzyme